MDTLSAWLRISILAISVLSAAGAVRADAPSPQLWTNPKDPAQRIYADGQHAIGGVREPTPLGQAEVTLLGIRRDHSHPYTGPVGGVLHGGRSDQAISGHWSMDPASKLVNIDASLGSIRKQFQIAVPEPSDPAPLRCGWAMGKVTSQHGGPARILTTNDAIQVGDTVTTSTRSAAILVLGDRSIAVMQEGSTLVLPAGMYNGGDAVERLRVTSGKIWFAVRKLAPGQKFEVETGQAVAAVRGTEFIVEANANGAAVTMADGSVDVSDPAGVQPPVHATAGFQQQIPVGGGAWPAAKAVNLAPVADEWDELLALADYCWPYRRENRNPFWQDRVDPPAQRARGHVDPLGLGSLVWDAGAGEQVAGGGDDAGNNGGDGANNGDGGGRGGRHHPGRGGLIGPIIGTGLGLIIDGIYHHRGGDRDRDHGNGDGKGKGKGDGNGKGKGKGDGGGGILFGTHGNGRRSR